MRISGHVLRTQILLALVASTAFGQNNEWTATKRRGRWARAEHWSVGVPGETSHVLVNNSHARGETRLSNLPEFAQVASLRVGFGSEQHGALEISREGLSIPANPADAMSGALTIGGDSGRGELRLSAGTLHVQNAVVIGDGVDAAGTLEVGSRSEVDCGLLQLSTPDGGSAKLIIDGPQSSITCDALIVHGDESEIVVTATREVSPIRTSLCPIVNGKLSINTRRLRREDTEILLIDNQSVDPVQGFFDDINLDGPAASHYELSYNGGDGNDIVLLRSDKPIRSFERWTALHFPADTTDEETKLWGRRRR